MWDAPGRLRIGIAYWLGWVPFCFLLLVTCASGYEVRYERPFVRLLGPQSLAAARLYLSEITLVMAGAALIWFVVGRELLLFENQLLTRRRGILGLGWSQAFELGDIRDLRVGTFPDFSAKGKWNPAALHAVVCFEYRGKVQRLGNLLGENEAIRIVEAINRYFPDIVMKPQYGQTSESPAQD